MAIPLGSSDEESREGARDLGCLLPEGLLLWLLRTALLSLAESSQLRIRGFS